MLSVKRYIIIGLVAATISCMQTNTMDCVCRCTFRCPTRVTVVHQPQQGQQPQPVQPPAQQEMEHSETSQNTQRSQSEHQVPAPEDVELPGATQQA